MSDPISMIQAVQAVGQTANAQALPTTAAPAVADPAAVSQFQAAMGIGDVQAVQAVQDIPFVRQLSETWHSAQYDYQALLHRIKGLEEISMQHSLSVVDLSALQYSVSSLSFQQEIVTNIAKKASDAVQTLIKNG